MPIDRNGGQYITANPQQPTQSSAPGIWDIDEQGSAQAAGRWPLPPNVVQRSLRFNSADSAYLDRTPTSVGNRRIWTFSIWTKLSGSFDDSFLFAGSVSSPPYVLAGVTGGGALFIDYFSSAGVLGWRKVSTSLYRDFSAWYHFLFAIDTTQGAADDRIKLYVNGSQITSFSSSTNPSLNVEATINNTVIHNIGRYITGGYMDGYMAEVNLIDGQALTPSSFGQTDAQTGQWIPQVYSGSYGTNGFRLQFLDNSGTTATTLGKDTSGMGNNWTPNNFSVAAGSGNDSLRDVPMNYYSPDNGLGGEVIGNYATWNPLQQSVLAGTQTLSNGNLDTQTTLGAVNATFFVSSGKWYWESTLTSGTSFAVTGIGQGSSTNYPGFSSTSYGYIFNGNKINNDTQVAYGATYTTGDVIGIALDLDSSTTTLTFYKNGVSQGVAYSGISGLFAPRIGNGTSGSQASWSTNFGQRPFAYTAPSGFKALCTQNLPWSGTITTSGTFTGNASTDGPFVYLNGIPTAMTINGNAVTFGTQADKLSNGFKVRSSSASYNASGSNTYSVSTTGNQFSKANAQANP